jgi:hypothetical protein
MRNIIVLSLLLISILVSAGSSVLARQPGAAPTRTLGASGALARLAPAAAISRPPVPAAAQAAPPLPLRRGIGGEASSMVVSGTLAYLGIGGQIEVLETSATSATLITTLPVPNHPQSLRRQGSTLYAATGVGGLQVIDLSDPVHPHIVGAYAPADLTAQNGVADVIIKGSFGYVTRADGRVQVLDLTNPTQPALLKTLTIAARTPNVPVTAGELAANDTLLAVHASQTVEMALNDHWIELYSLSNPASPQLVGTIADTWALDMVIQGTRLYVLRIGGWDIYDVSAPQQPVRLNPDQEWEVGSTITVVGTTLYVGNKDVETYALNTWDVSDPAHPARIASTVIPQEAREIVVAGSRMHVMYGSEFASGLIQLDGVGGALALRDVLTLPSYPIAVEKVGSLLYVLDWFAGLFIYEVSPNSQPGLRGRYQIPHNASLMATADLHVRDNRAYLTYVALPEAVFAVLDISTPEQPALLGEHRWETNQGVRELQFGLVGNYAYVGNDIFDVSDPTRLGAPIGQLTADSFLYDLALDGTIAYLAMEQGLVIMDTTNPAAPVVLSSLPPQGPEPFTSVTVDKQIAYLISGWGMTFVDVRTPSHPVVLGNYSPDEANVRPQGVAVYHGMLNISMSAWKGESYVQVVQITDPAHPVTIAKTPVWGRPEQLLDDGTSLYIAAGTGGVVSLTNSIAARLVADPTTPGVTIVDFGFQAPALTVRAGTSVSWSNTGAVEHTVTSTAIGASTTAAAWDSGKLATGQVFSHTFDTLGTFAYRCTIHPAMTGTIAVVEMNHKAYLPKVGR